jgi:hypothetical protein
MQSSNADMRAHHNARAKHFHGLAQAQKKEAALAKNRRDFLAWNLHQSRWAEYRRTRDDHKAKARFFA